MTDGPLPHLAASDDTEVLPRVPAPPGVPEVPALADLAGPGRPSVDAVAGHRPPGDPDASPRTRRPTRSMRARADEMARVLDRAAARGSTRRLTSLPAAVAVAGAVAVGGVGLALGIAAERTGEQLALPGMPDVPAEPMPPPADSTDPGATGVLDPLTVTADTPAPRADAGPIRRTGAPDAPETPGRGARRAPANPTADGDGRTPDDAAPRSTTTRTPRATTTTQTPPTTPRSTGEDPTSASPTDGGDADETGRSAGDPDAGTADGTSALR